jgi:tRNA (mo5U34)-methyltransferase
MVVMADQPTLLERRSFNPVAEGLSRTGLYHSFELPDGTRLQGAMPMEWQNERLRTFRLPDDLNGKRVLDIGPWDGFFTFALEQRGAELTAVDYVDLDTFRALHRAFGSKARYLQMDAYELDAAMLGTFDIVLCLGVLYHLKHPLLALERISAVTTDVCIIDTFVTDGQQWQQGARAEIPSIEFYERGELGGQLDNWCGPTVSAVEALARCAGFARTEVLRVTDTTACIAAHRRWADLPSDDGPLPQVLGLTCHLHRGRTFRSHKEEYIEFWCARAASAPPPLEEVFLEVDGFGVSPLSCALADGTLHINFARPYGLCAGRHKARLKIGSGRWSDDWPFYIDLPPVNSLVELVSVQDGVAWTTGEVDWGHGGWAAAWARGLSPEADPGNTTVYVSGVPHLPNAIDSDRGQINFRLRPVIFPGKHDVRLIHRGAESASVPVTVGGTPPAIRGLEQLR